MCKDISMLAAKFSRASRMLATHFSTVTFSGSSSIAIEGIKEHVFGGQVGRQRVVDIRLGQGIEIKW